MKVALVHDYIKEYGGAERVLEALCEIFPGAPIYTSMCVPNSTAGKIFARRKIITSWGNKILPHFHLYSILRFLTPLIWESFDFSKYDLVILSSSWYITKLLRSPRLPKTTKVICYCHTPPRWLYGYKTPINWKKFWPVKVYGEIVGHFLRMYDFKAAQRVDYFIANSKEVRARIKKFYRRDSTVIYPPVDVGATAANGNFFSASDSLAKKRFTSKEKSSALANEASKNLLAASVLNNYFLVVSRLEGTKNIDLAIRACNKLGYELWVVGTGSQKKYLKSISGPTIKFLGRVEDDKLWEIYKNCKALICTAEDEDFGITPVEAMAQGRPVIAFRGGGYLETVLEGKTGVFYPPATPARSAGGRGDEPTVESLIKTMEKFKSLKFKEEDCRKQAEKFSKERFKKEIIDFVNIIADSETSSE